MTLIVGNCKVAEENGRARVFALCKRRDRNVLAPISSEGDPIIRGIKSVRNSSRLDMQVGRLAADLEEMSFGLSVPLGRNLQGGQSLIMQVTLDNGTIHRLPAPDVSEAEGYRYVILALARRVGLDWDVRRLRNPEVYRDRQELCLTYRLPAWWCERA